MADASDCRQEDLNFPNKAALYLCAIEDSEYREDNINCEWTVHLREQLFVTCSVWDNVYGFNMSCIKELALIEPLVDVCEPKQLMSKPCQILVSPYLAAFSLV